MLEKKQYNNCLIALHLYKKVYKKIDKKDKKDNKIIGLDKMRCYINDLYQEII